MDKVLVTSCNSYLGFSLSKFLLNEGFKLVGTFRRQNPRVTILEKEFPETFVAVNVDLGTWNDFSKLPQGINYVVHNSATYPWSNVTNEEVVICNVNGTLNLTKWINDYNKNIKKFILISSLSVYGKVENNYLNESTIKKSDDVYGVTKHLSEIIVNNDLNVDKKITIRLPVVLGYSAHRAWIPQAVEKLLLNEEVIIFNEKNKYNSLTTDIQLSRFVNSLLINEYKYSSIDVNIGASNAMTVFQIIDYLKNSLHSKSAISNNVVDSPTYLIDSEKAINIGYTPPSVLDALNHYIESLKLDIFKN